MVASLTQGSALPRLQAAVAAYAPEVFGQAKAFLRQSSDRAGPAQDLCQIEDLSTTAAEAATRLAEAAWTAVQRPQCDPAWRFVYVASQLSMAATKLDRAAQGAACAHEAVEALDRALIMGADWHALRHVIWEIDGLGASASLGMETPPNGHASLDSLEMPCVPFSGIAPVARCNAADLKIKQMAFKERFWKTDTPVVISGGMAEWAARPKWADLHWWMHRHGSRIVPVELGRHGDAAWQEQMMRFGDFIEQHMLPSALGRAEPEVAYLAQHQLFDQLPSLQADFCFPEIFHVGEVEVVNAWIGTAAATSPTHFDSYDNFLAQVAGYKYIRLYAEDQTPYMYAKSGSGGTSRNRQMNVSAVDVECPDLAAFPHFAKAQYCDLLLQPGDMLYIPRGCWHYVRSCTPAISVNFWV